MSLLLLSEADFFPAVPRSPPARAKDQSAADQPSSSGQQQNGFPENAANLVYCNDPAGRSCTAADQVLLVPVLSGHALLLWLGGRVPTRLRILTPQGCWLKVGNTRGLPQFCLRLAQLVGQLRLELVAVPVNNTTGEIALLMPFLYLPARTEGPRGLAFFRAYALHCLPLLEYIVSEAAVPGATTLENGSKARTLENVFRYVGMMHVSSHLNESRLETEQDALEKEARRQADIRALVERRAGAEGLAGAQELFEARTGPLVAAREEDFEVQHEEARFIRWMLAMPVQFKPKNPFENLMVLNHIHVQDIGALRLSRINGGGFSSIYLTELRYLYVYSCEDHEALHPPQAAGAQGNKLLHKYVVVKKEEGGGRVRSQRELEVLKKIKNGSSVFLPKYYVVTNRDNPHADALFMDFIPSRTLKEYLLLAAPSLLSKLYLAFSVAQALRYIRDYRIVHLDLKPNNVMIYCNMLVKLIDFGEAHHPDLPPHKPGYTVPYSPPEIFARAPAYSSKSDVYSFGVLLFEMLYGAYPYDIFEPTRLVPLAMQDYLQRWMFVPEEAETYGEGTVMRVLNTIISRCLASTPQDRPELDWIALIIKLCFELLQ